MFGNNSSSQSSSTDMFSSNQSTPNTESYSSSSSESLYGSSQDLFEEKPQTNDIFNMFNSSQPSQPSQTIPQQESASNILNSIDDESQEEDDSYNERPYFKIRTYD